MKNNPPKVVLKGSKKDGYVITIYGRDNFIGDLAVTFEELIELRRSIGKIIPKFK